MDRSRSFFSFKGMNITNPTNRLAAEKSPYLLQHAGNPVDWYPWCDEAFVRARAEGKPVFLSVGYATCHWCHVMERESFENPEIARLLNEHFIAIKVDREERPDVDGLYMTALQATGAQGGWPMSMFLMPDGRPFYGGTYFPPESRGGRAGFPELLRRIADAWVHEHDRVEESAGNIMEFLHDLGSSKTAKVDPESDIMNLCYRQIAPTYDAEYGGFGRAPKFPRPVALRFLFRYFWRTGQEQALSMALGTLRGIISGGMYDHLGGGFHRYSVDAGWRVPHFEKMLYDQGQIVEALLDGYLLSGDDAIARAARETLDYVLRDLLTEEGGFASAEDADSPEQDAPARKGEGAFYVWTHQELAGVLGAEFPLFAFVYGIDEEGNVRFDPQGEFVGKNILFKAASESDAAKKLDSTEADVTKTLRESRAWLLRSRSRRPRPLRDDKIITAWNGLMIGALARASFVLGEPRYLAAAGKVADFLLSRLVDTHEGVLYRRLREGDVAVKGMLDDYAFLTHGLIALYQGSGMLRYRDAAQQLNTLMLEKFRDPASGALFDADGTDSSILVRMKSRYDGAEPTGNSIAAANLVLLSRILEKPELSGRANGILDDFAGLLTSQPLTVPMLACVRDALSLPPEHVVIVGPADDGVVLAMIRMAYSTYHPDRIVLLFSGDEDLPADSPWASMKPVGGKPAAYVCRDYTCQLPVTSIEDLDQLLQSSGGPKKHHTAGEKNA
jgi:uncharacterized protein YyaL (SSP411 family)